MKNDNENLSREEKQLLVSKMEAKKLLLANALKVLENHRKHLLYKELPFTKSKTHTRKIYEELCEVFGWKKSLSDQFGRQGAPLCAHDVDESGKYDVWFISHPSYDAEELKQVPNKQNAANVILDDGDTIIEKINPARWDEYANEVYRITFIKVKNVYVFSGVYEITKNGSTRTWQRISLTYPMLEN